MNLEEILHKKMVPLSFQMGNDLESPIYKVFFKSRPEKKYFIAVEIAKRATRHIILENICEDDHSINHLVIFTEEQFEDLILLNNLIHRISLVEGIWGFDIYGIDLKYICNFPHFCGHGLQLKDPHILKAKEKALEILQERLQIENKSYVELFIRKNYLNPIQKEYEKVNAKVRHFYDSLPGAAEYNELHKEERKKIKREHKQETEKIYNELVHNGTIPIKWRSEHALFELVAIYFPDALYQHYPDWLTPQNFDIFVPSINVAFEYQGIQHYKPIAHFGGEEALKRRQELDRLKKEKSNAHNVKIIEWHYEEPITKILLVKKLQNIAITL